MKKNRIVDEVRLAIVGYGGMGSNHGNYLWKDPVPGARLAAVCDIRSERLEAAKKAFGDDMPTYASIDEARLGSVPNTPVTLPAMDPVTGP